MSILDFSSFSYTVGLAADSWLVYMDRLLTPGVESEEVWLKIEKLINIYYDALDAPKTGKKVCLFLWIILGNALGCRSE